MVRQPYFRIVPLLFGATLCSHMLLNGEAPASAAAAFSAHIRATETRINAIVQKKGLFLWADTAERRAKLQSGAVVCEPRIGRGYLSAPHGLIHHWVGAIFIPGLPVERVLQLLQDYDNHKNTYKPEVIASRTLERRGNDFRVKLRLLERKLTVTIVLDTEYDVHYSPLDDGDFSSRAYSTRIVEIANAGTAREREKTGREDRGYLWQLYSYWLFRERDGGSYVECEAVALSRDIPGAAKLMDPVVRSIIRGLPKGFLANTLQATRELALASGPQSDR